MNQLERLRGMTALVADTGDIGAIAKHRPEDATTNPSLILKAAATPEYAPLIEQALGEAKAEHAGKADRLADALDRVAVAAGSEILRLVPGRVSTEVDARLSFDREGTIAKARRLIELYGRRGIAPERVLVKIAATWEGIRAAEALEREGIRCNLTLLFGFGQALASAQAGATLISPFVGRIFDWGKAHGLDPDCAPEEDPGVVSVRRIWRHLKERGYPTVVMGASFRNKGEILALSGIDRLTIAPSLLSELAASEEPFARALEPVEPGQARGEPMGEGRFRWELCADAMATEKLAEGIRLFAADAEKLEAELARRL